MKKKLSVVLIGCMLAFSLICCEKQTTVSAKEETNTELSNEILGTDSLIKIGNGLWYDSSTKIVYWWNGSLGEDSLSTSKWDTAPTAYYAPNGLPYKYNPKNNTFEEIEN